ncbi:hypothetical protein V3C99_010881 [Haemonchus contortus]
MNTDFTKIDGVKVFTNVGLWPYRDDEVRLWGGTIRLDASEAETDHLYKVRCSCYKSHMALLRCTHGSGRVRMGDIKYLWLKVPEPAITTAILTLFIDNHSVYLNLYKLDGAEELYFGTGDPNKLAVIGRTPSRPKWECRDTNESAFEMISNLIKPLLENVPSQLSDYLLEATPQSTVWQRMEALVYPVVLELLEDLGEFAKRENRNPRLPVHEGSLTKPLSGCIATDVTELILIRLSEKLRQEYGTFNQTPISR